LYQYDACTTRCSSWRLLTTVLCRDVTRSRQTQPHLRILPRGKHQALFPNAQTAFLLFQGSPKLKFTFASKLFAVSSRRKFTPMIIILYSSSAGISHVAASMPRLIYILSCRCNLSFSNLSLSHLQGQQAKALRPIETTRALITSTSRTKPSLGKNKHVRYRSTWV